MQETKETRVPSLSLDDPLEEGMAIHSSILAWRIPWTEEPGGLLSIGSQSDTIDTTFLAWRIPGMAESGGLPSMGSHRVGHD